MDFFVIRRLSAVLLAMLVVGCATHAMTSGRVVLKDEHSAIDVRISDRDRGLIQEHYQRGKKKHKGMPPGLAKRGDDLPPGLAKRDRLPPGLQGKSLPHALEQRLSRLPANYIRLRIGRDIVLLDEKTRVVIDVVYGVAF
jgi:hypothetical protein